MEVSAIEPGVGRPGGATQLQVLNEKGKEVTVEDMVMEGVLVGV